jgi:hypothetical protein
MVPLLSILAQYLVDPVLLGFRVGNNEEFVGDDGLHEEGPRDGEGLKHIFPPSFAISNSKN